MMLDQDFALIRAHSNNIDRYRRLLRTKLSELERRYLERRLCEERAALATLTAGGFPPALSRPGARSASAALGGER
ncbi:hypothetical protein M2171_002510 [Bradyrhizobium japonicum USDA 38]|jgi:hypothetical protein|uniref:hypothetical protein n=1 Tax=Bradyrhizobium TaxID=374 RepID=UPI00286D85B9|nr:hypothetical protein [Bradyrhizobium japonicum]MCS3893377.1 hypothetical protein [Bradyrhizobium japonicum USDA 38]MCS3945891.1 hypothetical protein [Bradyrhizobium japonicum]